MRGMATTRTTRGVEIGIIGAVGIAAVARAGVAARARACFGLVTDDACVGVCVVCVCVECVVGVGDGSEEP